MTIRLRFVHSASLISNGIIAQTGGWCSHVEAVTPDGYYLGAHLDGGVMKRDPNYDSTTWDAQLFVDLQADVEMTEKFYHYLHAVVGEPYDFGAIREFVLHFEGHQKHRVICSALITLAVRWCEWFPFPLGIAAHEISPRDLLLMLASRIEIGAPERRVLAKHEFGQNPV